MIKKFYIRTVKSGMYVTKKRANGTYGLDTDYTRAISFDDAEKASKACAVINKTFAEDKQEHFEVVKEIRREH